MISLLEILKEAVNGPKAIILAGGAGAGKSYTIKNLLGDLDEESGVFTPKGSSTEFKYMNPDDLIEKEGLSLGAAQGRFRQIFQDAQDKKVNIIWDTTGANTKNTLSQLPGYDKFMVMVYTHPIISLLQNAKRDRKIPFNAVIKTWNSVYGNIAAYQEEFGDNFVLVRNIVPGYEEDMAAFDKASQGGKDSLEQYLTSLITNDKEGKFKSTFNKEFNFASKEIEQMFNTALQQSSYTSNDEKILKSVKKEFEKEYNKKNVDPGVKVLDKKLASARKTRDRNAKNHDENVDGVVAKLSSPEFMELTEPLSDQEIQSRLQNFVA
jgi:hypothetical protein